MTLNIAKPLGQKSYGSIPHLLGSKRGPGDRGVNEGQHRICVATCRRGDRIIVQEKLDGTNVAVAKIDGAIVPLGRSGYRAETSNYEQHRLFAAWAYERQGTFDFILEDGERLCGEWLAQAHGTRYELGTRQPFVPFDLMRGTTRATVDEVRERVINEGFDIPPILSDGGPCSIESAVETLGARGFYGAECKPEGVVYRVEHKGKVDFLAKFVRDDFPTGRYLPGVEGAESEVEVWNWRPTP